MPTISRPDDPANRMWRGATGRVDRLAAHVARVELETVFRHLLARLGSFEVSGPVDRLSSIINGSIKHLPIRYRIA